MWMGVGLCTCAFGGRGDAGGLPPSCFTLVFETRTLTEAGAHQLGQTGWPVSLGVPSVSTCLCYHAWLFYVGVWVWSRDLVFGWQAPYWLSHLPNAPRFTPSMYWGQTIHTSIFLRQFDFESLPWITDSIAPLCIKRYSLWTLPTSFNLKMRWKGLEVCCSV